MHDGHLYPLKWALCVIKIAHQYAPLFLLSADDVLQSTLKYMIIEDSEDQEINLNDQNGRNILEFSKVESMLDR